MQSEAWRRQFEKITHIVAEGIIVLDRNGFIIYANPAVDDILGLAHDAIIGHEFPDETWGITTRAGEPLPEAERPFDEAKKTKHTVCDIEYILNRPDGTSLTVSVNAVPFLDERGEVIAVAIAFTDIEKTVQALEEIRESRRQVLDILESITDAFFALDNLWRFTYINRRATELLGRQRELLLFRSIWRELPELADSILRERLDEAKETLVPASFELLYTPTQRWLDVRAYPYENGVSVYFDDITERKQAEQERERLISRLATIHDITDIVVSSLDVAEVSQRVVDGLGERFGLATASVFVVNEEKQELEPLAFYGYPLELLKKIPPAKVDSEYESARVFRSGRPIMVEDIDAASVADVVRLTAKKLEEMTGRPFKSYVILPLTAYRRTIGTLTLTWPEPRTFTQDDVGLFDSIAHEITVGLENARLFESVQASSQRFDAVLNSMNDGFVIYDRQWRYVYLNDKIAEQAQKPKEELLGKNVWDVFPEAVGSKFYTEWHRAMDERVPVRFEEYFEPVDTWFENRVYPFEDGIAVIARDITRERRAERERRFYVSILDNVPIPISYLDENLIYRQVNKAAAAALGHSAEEILGRPLAEIVKENPHIYEAVKGVLETGIPYQEMLSFTTPDETEPNYFIVSYAPDKDETGRVRGVFAEGFPVTEVVRERERLFNEAQTERSQLQAVLRSLTEGVIISDPKGNVLDMNEATRAIFGFESVKRVKRNLVEFTEFRLYTLEGKEIPREEWPLARALRGETFTDYEIKVHNVETGDKLIVSYGGTPVRDTDGTIILAVLTVRDVTEQKRTEKEREEALETTRYLLQAADDLAHWTDLDQVLSTLAEVILRSIAHTRVWVFLWDEAKREAKLEVSTGTNALPTGTVFPFDTLSSVTKTAIVERRTVIVDYDALPKEQRGPAEKLGSHISLLVPFTQRDRLSGIIGIDDPGERREFTPREIELVEGIASQAAVAIENARLFHELEVERNRLNEALQQAQFFANIIENSAQPFAAGTPDGRLIAFNRAYAELTGYSEEELRSASWRVDLTPPEWREENARVFAEVLRTGKPQRFEKEYFRKDGSRIPIELYLNVVTDESGNPLYYYSFFTDLTERKERERLGDALNDINIIIGSTFDPDEILRRVVSGAARAIGAESAAVDMPEDGHWVVRYIYGLPERALGMRITGEEVPSIGIAVRTREPVVINDVETDTRVSPRAAEYGLKSFMVVPIISKDQVNGIILFNYHSKKATFTRLQVDFAIKLASSVALALENARLYERTLASARAFESVGQMGSLITSTLSTDDALGQVLGYSMLLLDVTAAVVLLLDEARGVFKVVASEGIPEPLRDSELSLTEARELKIDKPSPRVANIGTWSKVPFFAAAYDEGFKSAVVSPMFLDGALSGLLMIPDTGELSPPEEVLAAFRLLTTQAATAIRNAERYEAERDVADTLQEALLTVPEHIDHLEYGYLYRSASEVAQVGGDFYDVFELEHGRVGIIIGDVSGKGLEASTLTAAVRNMIRAYAYEGYSPKEVMGKANNAMKAITGEGLFITVVFALLDEPTGRLTYCNCGHPFPIIKRMAGEIALLSTLSPIIGAFANLSYVEDETVFEEGDVLILYTDGLIEARRPDGEFYTEERLENFVRRLKKASAKDMAQIIFNEVKQFAGGKLTDDIALFAIALKDEEHV